MRQGRPNIKNARTNIAKTAGGMYAPMTAKPQKRTRRHRQNWKHIVRQLCTYRTLIVRLWHAYRMLMVRLPCGFRTLSVRVVNAYCALIVRLSIAYSTVV